MDNEMKDYLERREAFIAKHPDLPDPEPVKCLNLIMRKEYAKEIVEGKKVVEIRAFSQHYSDRLYDKNVLEYENAHWDDEEMREGILEFTDSVRPVEKIHFHPYNNNWYLDVTCVENGTVVVNEEQVAYLRDTYGCHEFDEMLEDLERRHVTDRPIFFFFVIGEVLGTNLE